MPNVGVSSTSKSAHDWVTYGIKLGCERAFWALCIYLYTWFYWSLTTSFISGGERRCIEHIYICARMSDLWSEIGMQTSIQDIISWSIHRILMTFDHTLHLWYRTKLYWIHRNLPPVFLCGEIGVQKAPGALSLKLYRVFQWSLATSFISDGERKCTRLIKNCSIVHGVKLVCKPAQRIYLLIYIKYLNESRSFSVDCWV